MSKTCCIDIDGVLNHYPQAWLLFLELGGLPFANQIDAKTRLTYSDYTRLKSLYRRSPEKRHQPPRAGAVEFIEELIEEGYNVILKTSRPIRDHPHLVGWTYDWLREHLFTFTEILFNRDHPAKPLSQYPDLEFIVDDNPQVTELFNKQGITAFLFDGDFDKILDTLA